MATIINNPPTERIVDKSSNGMGFVIGLIALVLLAILLFAYGIPALRNSNGTSGTQINVPDKVDVNVNNPSGSGAQ